MLSKTIAVTFFVASAHAESEEYKGKGESLTETERCYKARYYDLGKLSPKEHYDKIGRAENRYWGCGKRISDWNAWNYLNQEPALQEKVGYEGEKAIEGAQLEWSKTGYK